MQQHFYISERYFKEIMKEELCSDKEAVEFEKIIKLILNSLENEEYKRMA